MGTPTVSVIVPCYNYGSVLPGCVDSVLGQAGVDVQVLIVDDCSADDSASIAAALAARDGRIAFRHHTSNQGLIATANEGLQWALGDFVVLLSADDLLAPGALQRAATVMQRHPGVGMAYGRAPYWDGASALPDTSARWRRTDVWKGEDWIGTRCRSAQNCISSPEVVVRNSVQRAVGGYDPGCYHASDLNMWLRIAAVSDIAYLRGATQAIYRVHADSMLRSADTPMVDLVERRKAFDAFFATGEALLDDGSALRRLAAQALARQALWRASRTVDRNHAGTSGSDAVDEFVAFALDVYPQARELREWRGLAARRRIGEGRSLWFPPFIATGVMHRLRSEVARRRWVRTGL